MAALQQSLDKLRAIHESPEHVADAIEAVYVAFEELCEASTFPMQASAYTHLMDAISDLVSWHPDFDIETGRLAEESTGWHS